MVEGEAEPAPGGLFGPSDGSRWGDLLADDMELTEPEQDPVEKATASVLAQTDVVNLELAAQRMKEILSRARRSPPRTASLRPC